MDDMKKVILVSPRFSLNGYDWWSMFKTLLIQVAAAAVTATIAWLAWLQGDSQNLPQYMIFLIPLLQVAFTQLGKYLQKLLDGPTAEVVEQSKRGQVPQGHVMDSGARKLE